MPPKQLFLKSNACYISGVPLSIKGIMVHSTGANNPNLRRYVGPDDGALGHNPNNNHWNQPTPDGRYVCVHAFIGKLANGDIATYQTLPWDMRGWHSGGGANNTHIGFEICEAHLDDSDYFNRVYQESVALCAYLCKMFGLDPSGDGVLIDHAEGHRRGIASNHGDVGHWFPRHGKNMNEFRQDVQNLMRENDVEPEPEPDPTPEPEPEPQPEPKPEPQPEPKPNPEIKGVKWYHLLLEFLKRLIRQVK